MTQAFERERGVLRASQRPSINGRLYVGQVRITGNGVLAKSWAEKQKWLVLGTRTGWGASEPEAFGTPL